MPEAGRLLVTGGSGYIGSTLVPQLLEAGFRVTVLDLREPALRSGAEFLRGDLRDAEILRWALRGAEAVVHLAAVSGRPACARRPRRARRTNVQGTAELLAAAAGRPVILASTLSCYGSVPEGLCDETTSARPISFYARTKLEAESLVLASPNGIVLRLATVYGLSPRMRLDLLLNAFVHTLASGQPLEIFEPEARRPFLHLTDAAQAFLLALRGSTKLAGGLFNVGDEKQNPSKRELAELIHRRFPEARLSYAGGGRDEDRRDYRVSFARFRGQGFRAEVGLEQGIDELARAFRRG